MLPVSISTVDKNRSRLDKYIICHLYIGHSAGIKITKYNRLHYDTWRNYVIEYLEFQLLSTDMILYTFSV